MKTPLWNVVLPNDPASAVFVAIAFCLLGCFFITARAATKSSWVFPVLGTEVLLLFFAVILSHHKYAVHAGRGFPPRPHSHGTFRSDDRSAKIPAAAAERRSTRAPARPRPSPSAPRPQRNDAGKRADPRLELR
ncbi:MAG TPA: hypothetical protein VF092_23320 [Longimicrobium sp.]